MTLAALMTRPVTITRTTAGTDTDAYGNVINVTETAETVGELQQRSHTEKEDLTVSDWELFLPAGTEIGSADRVTVGGDTFEVIGESWQVYNPRTHQFHHVLCSLRRVGGADD